MILNRSIFHHTLVPLIALTILMVPSIRVLAEQSAAEKVYSGETFENVLKDLSSLSGYQIEVPEDLLSIKVYGNFSVDEVDHFLSRVLRDYNHSFYVNETQKYHDSPRLWRKTRRLGAGGRRNWRQKNRYLYWPSQRRSCQNA